MLCVQPLASPPPASFIALLSFFPFFLSSLLSFFLITFPFFFLFSFLSFLLSFLHSFLWGSTLRYIVSFYV